MHPLRALVQTIAPISLALAIGISITSLLWLVKREMNRERQVILGMAQQLDGRTRELRRMAETHWATKQTIQSEDLAPPRKLSLPDGQRWEAARILTNEGLLPAGELGRSALDLISARWLFT